MAKSLFVALAFVAALLAACAGAMHFLNCKT